MKDSTKKQCQDIIRSVESIIDLIEYQIADLEKEEDYKSAQGLYDAMSCLYDSLECIEHAIKKKRRSNLSV